MQSLRAGVAPYIGLHHIQVGRLREVEGMIRDIERIAEGGAAFRVVVGDYGSGKTFFLNLVRSIALEKKLVTAHADLSPDRRLHSTSGHGRSLYAELVRNLATRTRLDGGALPSIIERFVTSAAAEAGHSGERVDAAISRKLRSLEEMVGGYDFAEVINRYWQGHEQHDEALMRRAEQWLRGEFTTKTDARSALGVRTIVDDGNVYDQLKLLARFVRLSGFSGLLICLDEMVNLYKLSNAQARSANYEQILRILNDSLQGSSEGIGFLLGGTPEFLSDPRRGLHSYAALASRLGENVFAQKGFVDHSGPVLRLANLTPEELFVLLQKLRTVFAHGDENQTLLPDEALHAFLTHCSRKVGDAYFRTPRLTIKAFLDLLAILEENPQAKWTDLVEQVRLSPDRAPDSDGDDDLATVRL